MSDFAVGDVVVCVDAHPCYCGTGYIRKGSAYRIIGIKSHPSWDCIGIILAGVRHIHENGWRDDRFRKLPKADEQFTAQMRSCKPVRVVA